MTQPVAQAINGRAVVNANAGTGATAIISAISQSGHRGRCAVTLGSGPQAGVLLQVLFDTPPLAAQAYSLSALAHEEAMLVGSFDDPDVHPIVLTSYPAPPTLGRFLATPIMDTSGTRKPPPMLGLEISFLGVVPGAAGASYTLAWAVL